MAENTHTDTHIDVECHKCGGTGTFHWSTMYGPQSGPCFSCDGTGVRREPRPEIVAERAKKAAARHAKKAAREAARLEARRQAALAVHGAWVWGLALWAAGATERARELAERVILQVLEGSRPADWQARALLEAALTPVSRHVGTVGRRLEVDVMLLSRCHYDSAYGAKTVYILRTRAGALLAWHTRSYLGREVEDERGGHAYIRTHVVEKGEWCKIRATVKAHGAYRGELQTEVSRLTVREIY